MASFMSLHLASIGQPYIPGWEQLRPFVAELWVIATAVAVLLTPFFTRGRSNAICALVTLCGFAAALIGLIAVGSGPDVVGNHFRGMLVVDEAALLWKAMLLLFAIGIVLMWFTTSAASMHEGDGPEFFVLLAGAMLGMLLMSSTSNLLMLALAVEMASLPSYVLAGFRKTHRVGAEASLKYVLFGAACSAVLVYGLSLLYGLSGTLQIEELAAIMASGKHGGVLLGAGVFALIVGLGFKISAVPFHFWCPDVFEGAGIDVAAFLSVASKGAGLVLLMRVLMLLASAAGFADVPGVSLTAIAWTIGIIGAVTATVGNTAAFVQENIKRLLAYSSIAHAGYMLCALSLLLNGSRPLLVQEQGLSYLAPAQALLLYLAVYMFMNLGAFTIAGLVHQATGSEKIADYAGLGRRAPLAAACMTAFMFSLVGLPPFAGFLAKLNVMYVLGANGGWWWALVVVIGVNTVLSLYYYARVVRVMYLVPSDAPPMHANPLGLGLGMACAAMLLLMLVGFAPLNDLSRRHGRIHMPPQPAAITHAAALPASVDAP
jgi:NADH-quinone oxidoreductase subunit N